ncbi:MAG TPA: hypothetical protein PLS94_11195 [Prolixibacteraceae bacterium]|nr:hypothetical protein [Prolixibacteraceae bacterium]HPR59862.1 hypothetical protein [Prolixibacteraceae bacterium]
MKPTILFLFILLSVGTFAQLKKSEATQYGIEVKRYYEQDLKDGDAEPSIFKEEFYDFRGELVEIKEYSEKGKKIDLWIKYKFDIKGNLIEETELDAKGEITRRMEYKYENGLRTEKLYYDSKNRLYQKRFYKYEYRK